MKKALLVIDMQNDYLWDKRKTKFNYDSSLVKSVNNTILNANALEKLIK